MNKESGEWVDVKKRTYELDWLRLYRIQALNEVKAPFPIQTNEKWKQSNFDSINQNLT